MITVKNLMILERLLLEIESRFKFQLRFAEVIELNGFIEEIGKVTDLFFTLQEEHYRKFSDNDALSEYHEKLMNDKVKMDTSKIIAFVKDISNRLYDEEFADIITKNQFWD
ncbi:MAG: hypothetical protein J6O49_20900 [Bacteroidaceae bacterium]|nr:hypothetical protein [Bacteroidaceae bacterium]